MRRGTTLGWCVAFVVVGVATSATAKDCVVSCDGQAPDLAERFGISNAIADPTACNSGSKHCLVLNQFIDGEGVVFTCHPGSVVDVSTSGDAVAKLVMTITSGPADRLGESWTATLKYDFRGVGQAGEGSGGPKKELHAGLQPKSVTDTWRYYDLTEGTLNRVGSNDYASLTQKPANSVHPLQFGMTANGKNTGLGASQWFDFVHHSGGSSASGWGDINANASPMQICQPTTIPDGGSCDDGNACTTSCAPLGVEKRYDAKNAFGAHGIYLIEFFNKKLTKMSMQAGSTFDVFYNGDARLHGSAKVVTGDHVGQIWNVDVRWKLRGVGPAGQGSGGPKGGFPKSVTDQWTYYDMVSGQISQVGNPTHYATFKQFPLGSKWPFQLGEGAGLGKDGLGGATWMKYMRFKNGAPVSDGTGDINVNLSPALSPPCVDTCTDGVCGGAPHDSLCDDGNACTTDACDASTGCVFTPTQQCEDGNPCTANDCNEATGACVNSPKGGACDDGSACTAGDVCEAGACAPGQPITCDDGNACTDDACNAATGCTYTPNQAACNDGDQCTTGDTCAAGACVGTGAANCDDGNACTADACSKKVGCTHKPQSVGCDDGNACTTGEKCQWGKCKGGAPVTCNDGNPCTNDTCSVATGCGATPNKAACDDGNVCTTGDHCSGGVCAPGAAVSCNDGNPCTDDACNPATGCTHTNNSAGCDDGSVCTTVDTCVSGACKGGAVQACNDGNACTADSCSPDTGCAHAPKAGACSDGNVCTLGDSCQAGVCQPGAAKTCDDGNECTDDSCHPSKGCVAQPNTSGCNDGDACTTGDSCVGGACTGAKVSCDDNNACTEDGCSSGSGCTFNPAPKNGAPCADGNACTSADKCNWGVCKGGVTVICADGNVCTDDSCDPKSGCVFAPNGAGCDDGNACTPDDACSGGACQGSGAVVCNDGNPCTQDSCDPGSGCTSAPAAGPCDDGNPCTAGDSCKSGSCHGGGPTSCDDGNPCTDDSCNPAKGCVHEANSAGCDDGNACTTGDACSGGKCVGGAAVSCNDGNACTDDSCQAASGCANTANAASCDDGNACTTADSCQNGS